MSSVPGSIPVIPAATGGNSPRGVVAPVASSDSLQNLLDVGRDYIRRGWAPLPVPRGEKGCRVKGWTALRIAEHELDQYFYFGDENIAVNLGSSNGNLVDVDVDDPMAVPIARRILPETACFGRTSKTPSHYLFHLDRESRKQAYLAPNGETLVELRAGKHCTMVPPSVHPSGERVEWVNDREPATIAAEDLAKRVRWIAAATLIAKEWPAQGARNQVAMALAGGLLSCGMSVEDATEFVDAVATAAGDEEASARAAVVPTTKTKRDAGEQVTGWPTLQEHIGKEVVTQVKKWLGARADASDASDARPHIGAGGDEERIGPVEVLLALTVSDIHFVDAGGLAYASWLAREVRHTDRIASGRYGDELRLRYYQNTQRVLGQNALDTVVAHLAAKAREKQGSVAVRVAHVGETCYLDLADAAGHVIEISSGGWRVVTECPAHFVRPRGMLALPVPAVGGSISLLRRLLNVTSEREWLLVVGFILSAFMPTGGRPILAVSGVQGSAKTSLCRTLKMLVDPHDTPLLAPPRQPDDLFIAAGANLIVVFDNLSWVSADLADSLCRISTGAAISKRKLFTDGDEFILKAHRPIILNGIPEFITRPDLADRSLSLDLQPIPPEERRAETEFSADFAASHASVLGGILDLVVLALRSHETTTMTATPRMADFVRWVVAAGGGLPGGASEFLAAIQDSQENLESAALEASEVAQAILTLMEGRDTLGETTASELLAMLNLTGGLGSPAKGADWPTTPQKLSSQLRRVIPLLQKHGVKVDFSRRPDKKRVRIIRISRMDQSGRGSTSE